MFLNLTWAAAAGRAGTPRGTVRRAALLLAAAATLAGCGSGSTHQAAPTGLPPTPSQSPCPPAAPGRGAWPAGIPSALPLPPGKAAATPVKSALKGLTVVTFDTPTSLRDSIVWVVRQVPKAGFFLGRGDAEQTEADAPFAGAGARGTFRMAAVQPCTTRWLVAAVPMAHAPGAAPTSPLLPMRRVSPSPLPFAP